MKITSKSFIDGSNIPVKHCMKAVSGGENISPQIGFHDIPSKTKSIAITFIDHHPIANKWVHWIAINIPSNIKFIEEGASMNNMPVGSIELINTFGFQGYGGPQPPKGSGKHKYVLTCYFLNQMIKISVRELNEDEFLHFIKPVIIDYTSITGFFEQK